ncbi:hypothetical protein D3C71_1453890 [compost metagenome]
MRAVAAQLRQQIGQAQALGNDRALHPGPLGRAHGLRRLDRLGGEARALPGLQHPRCHAARGGRDAHRAREDAHQGLIVLSMRAEFRAQRLGQALRQRDHEAPPRVLGGGHEDPAAQQGQAPLAGAELHIDRGVGVEQQLRAVRQYDAALLARARAVIRGPLPPGWVPGCVLLQRIAHPAADHEHHQRLDRTPARMRCGAQRGMRHRRHARQAAQPALQALDALPRKFMRDMLGAPIVQGLRGQGRRPRLQLQHPLHRALRYIAWNLL